MRYTLYKTYIVLTSNHNFHPKKNKLIDRKNIVNGYLVSVLYSTHHIAAREAVSYESKFKSNDNPSYRKKRF